MKREERVSDVGEEWRVGVLVAAAVIQSEGGNPVKSILVVGKKHIFPLFAYVLS